MTDAAGPGERTGRARAAPLWVRIAATVLLAFVVATAVAGVWLGRRLSALSEAETEGGLATDMAVLAPGVRSALSAGEPALLTEIAAAAARDGGVRVTVMLPDGRVVADSEHRLPMPSHADRPEMQEAMRDGRGRSDRVSTSTGESYLYLAQRIDGADGRPVGVLRLARPLRSVQAVDREVLHVLLLAALLGLPVAAAVGWFAARRIAAPLEEMTAAADRMARGDFAVLPRADRGDEAGRLADALARMGSQIAETLRVRDTQRAEIEAVLASMGEGVLAVDAEGRVLLANRAVAECLRLAQVPAPGTSLREVVRVPEITAQLRRALGGRRVAEVDVALPGPAAPVLGVGAAPILGEGGAVQGAVVVLRDVTVMRRLERTRLDFVANVSHELRTPLAAVLGALETVRELGDEDPETRARMLDTATRHGRRLAAIVDDLLALSQIESEGERLERAPVPLLRTVRAAASAVAGEARTRGVTVRLPDGGGPDVEVLGHEGRLEQVWTNLLGNAVKYNRDGGTVTVEVSVDAAARTAEVAVRDTGPGIAAEHLPRIFERFYRVDKGRSRDQGGTGLGLAIVRHIVLAHRGTIRVESTPGAGSTFRVRLPLAGAGDAPLTPSS